MSEDAGWALVERGNEHFDARELEAAVEAYTAATAHLPTATEPWFNLGVACLHLGDRIGGIAAVGDGVRMRSANDAWYVRARDAFTRVLELDPASHKAFVMRGHVHHKRLDEDLARADWTAARRLGDPFAGNLLRLVSAR